MTKEEREKELEEVLKESKEAFEVWKSDNFERGTDIHRAWIAASYTAQMCAVVEADDYEENDGGEEEPEYYY